jgi:FtsP/CotA-like multicopper oxidase with cupredoxin domain
MQATVAPTPNIRWFAACAALTLLTVGLAAPSRAHAAAVVHTSAAAVVHTAAAVHSAAVSPTAAVTGQALVASTACSSSGSAVTCDLWAKTGTLALSGTTVPIWGFAASDAAAAGVPGPVLEATSGQTVTINLHNQLTQALSLTLPGIPLGVGGSIVPEDTVGAAAGDVKSYTFNAPAAGTYLYEAGHTANGARQAAMGLVGGLIVRPSGFDALAPTEDGTAATAFDDEAVLVLSEVDPAFNAAPTTYDLRNYHPKYRLINGHAFPSTDPISTDHGRRTLLRYVNAGLLGHAMGALGVKQEVLAVTARADSNRSSLVSEMIAAGQTEDLRVTFPVGGADQLPLYETAGTLDNAGQVTAVGSRIIGFGGMLTFLAAAPSAPGGDTVGPNVSGVAVSPNPTSALTPATVTANVSDVTTGNHNISRAEFLVDGMAVNVGGGTAMTASDGVFDAPTETVTGTLTTTVLQTLAQGSHTLYVRAMDDQNNWGPAASLVFTAASTGPAIRGLSLSPNPANGSSAVQLGATGDDSSIGGQVVAGEYFVDSVGANGTGSAVTVATPAAVAAGSATLSTAVLGGLVDGSHTVSVHFKDSQNLWGPLATIDLKLDRTGPTLGATGNQVTPNPTNGSVGDPVDPTSLKAHASVVDAAVSGVSSAVVGAEGFLDNPGASGTGIVFVADDGSWNSSSESGYGLVPLSQLTGLAQGQHTVYVHGRDAAGNWGTLAPITFTLDRGPAVTAAAPGSVGTLAGPVSVGTASALTGTTVTAAEFFEATDPGAGNGSALTFSPAGSATATLSVLPRSLSVGAHTLLVRAKDSNGMWGKTTLVQITVTGLFSNGFEAGNTTGWTSSTLAANSVTKLAAIDGSYGLQVAATARYVQRNLTATSLHAAFKLQTSTLITPTGGVTVFQARTSGGVQVLAVQFRNTSAAGPRQVRLVTGSSPASTWVTIPAGVTDLRIDRSATGSVTLSANGVQIQTPLASTGTVANVRLGIISGTVSAGSIQLDSFGATS